jgi:hypothetical protein
MFLENLKHPYNTDDLYTDAAITVPMPPLRIEHHTSLECFCILTAAKPLMHATSVKRKETTVTDLCVMREYTLWHSAGLRKTSASTCRVRRR